MSKAAVWTKAQSLVLFMNAQETLKSERWQKLGGTVFKGLVHGVHQEMALGSP